MQKPQDNYNKSIKLGYTDTITLERVRDLVEMMEERSLSIAHTTIMHWVHQYGPELDERVRRHLKTTNDSWKHM